MCKKRRNESAGNMIWQRGRSGTGSRRLTYHAGCHRRGNLPSVVEERCGRRKEGAREMVVLGICRHNANADQHVQALGGLWDDIFVMPYCTTRTLSLRATMHRGPTVATATWRADKPSPLRHLQAGLARVEGRIERGSTGSTALRQLKMEPSATAPRDSELGLPLKID